MDLINPEYKILKVLEKFQFVSELTISLNLQISKFHGSLYNKKS